MKKILSIALLIALSLMLYGCEDKAIIKDKNLESYKLVQVVNPSGSGEDDVRYMIEKNGTAVCYTDKDGNKKYYRDFGSTTYEYKTTTKNDKTYVTGTTTSSVDFTDKFEALKGLTKEEVTKKGNVVTFKELKKNERLLPFIDGDIELEKGTNLHDAYKLGLVEFSEATLLVKKGVPQSLTLKVNYANKETVVLVQFSSVDSSSFEMLNEDLTDKTYTKFFNENGAVVTIDFAEYGQIKVQLFDKSLADQNTINYFIYLLKKNQYKDVSVETTSSTSIAFADSEESLKKTIATISEPKVSNLRGTLSMVVTDDSNNTAKLILNFKDNSSNDSKYTPIGGVIEGFDVMDNLSILTSTEYDNLKVNVTVEYNNFNYTKPIFK